MRSDPKEAPLERAGGSSHCRCYLEVPPADFERLSSTIVELGTSHLKVILRISQKMQHSKSIQIGHISDCSYPQLVTQPGGYPREICPTTRSPENSVETAGATTTLNLST